MTTDELRKPTVPTTYVLLTLQLAGEHGVSREQRLKGLKLATGFLDQPDPRFCLLEYAHLCIPALQLTGEAGLGS